MKLFRIPTHVSTLFYKTITSPHGQFFHLIRMLIKMMPNSEQTNQSPLFWSQTERIKQNGASNKPEKYKISHSDLAQAVQKVFPSSKLSPHEQAMRFLESSCNPVSGYPTQIAISSDFSPSVPLKSEIFSSATIYDLLQDMPGISPIIPSLLLDFIERSKGDYGLYSFFTDGTFKNDVDSTSTCLWALLHANRISRKEAKTIAKIVSMNRADRSIEGGGALEIYIPMYRDPNGLKKKGGGRPGVVDVGILANVLRLLYFLNMEWEAIDSEDYIFQWITRRSYCNLASKNYDADTVLYFLSNPVRESEAMRKRFGLILMQRWLESIGKTRKPMALAHRILTAHNLGLMDGSADKEYSSLWTKSKFNMFKEEVKLLRDLQNEESGAWDLDVFYHCTRFFYGSQPVVTAYAAKALYLSHNIFQ